MSIPELRQVETGQFYVFWTDGRRSKRKSMGTKNEADAKARFAQWLLLDGQEIGQEVEFTVTELWSVYSAKHSVAAPNALRFAWANLQPHFGALASAAIDQDIVDDYGRLRMLGRIGRPAKFSTIRRELAALRACLNWCSEPKRKLLSARQLPDFDLPPEGEPRDRWLHTWETQKLLTAARTLRAGSRLSRGERFLWLALETGARKTALLELTWDRVDFETNVIHLNVPGRIATKKRRADVPISASLRPVLVRAYEERTGPLVLDHQSGIWKTIKAIAEKAGVADVSPNVLRHTAATHMARRGVPLWKIAKILGNSLVMVEKVYAKHCPDDLREAVDMISGGVLEAAE